LVCFSAREEIPRALKELDEGMKIAERNGDSKMAARFAQEIATVSKTAKPAPSRRRWKHHGPKSAKAL